MQLNKINHSYLITIKRKTNVEDGMKIYKFFKEKQEQIKIKEGEDRCEFSVKLYTSKSEELSHCFILSNLSIHPKLMTVFTIQLKEIINYRSYLGCIKCVDEQYSELETAKDSKFSMMFDSDGINYII